MSEAAGTAIVIPRENVNDESATLVAWEVADGAFVEAGKLVAQIETSKAVVDLLAPASGVLHHQAKPGQDIPIGAAIGRIGGGAAATAPVAPAPTSNGANGSHANGSTPVSPGLPLAPSVRRMVSEGGVDPSQVAGTGRGGRITKGDLVAFLESGTPEPPPPPRSTRFSRKALDRLQALGLDKASFEGRGLIRLRDISPREEDSGLGTRDSGLGTQDSGLRTQDSGLGTQDSGLGTVEPKQRPSALSPRPSALSPRPSALSPRPSALSPESSALSPLPAAPSRPVAASGVSTRSEPLSRAKRTEGKYLRSGFESTLASVITVACPTRGFRAAFGPDASALIVFEVARLLRKYPAFNAYHDDGVAHYYDEVNLGFAVDAGRGLKVPIIREADRKGVAAIGSEMRDLVVSYLGDRLPVEALSGGTFTLTDLSGEGVVAFHPLINRGQAAILGVCAEVFPPGSREGTFNLVLAFDHQLAEGRSAARFLGDLRDRLASHEASALASRPAEAAPAGEPCCSRCLATFSALQRDGHVLVQTVRGDGSTRLLCKLCLEGWT